MAHPAICSLAICVLACLSTLAWTPAAGAASPDFVTDIQPIFNASCVECHGPAKQKGGLRLDSRAAAMKGGATGPSILPGKGADSYLVHRLKGLGDEPKMPEKKPELTAEQIATIVKWIDAGAVWPDSAAGDAGGITHWSFRKPVRVQPPAVNRAGWDRNPIDAFILAKLSAAKISPSPEADKATLLRRVHLDITGLPPTPAEIDAFLADRSPDAYEKVVNRLLDSPAYGERWGKHWLDQARYADSNGYSIDAPREIWKYRDWVIDAINRDLPFDQFTIEQFAGDMLPKATLDQKVATGFHRNTQINQEGGIDPEQFRVEAVIDRVGTTGTVWLGLSIACAQCHNHKFDPISQKEYYRLFAFLNNQDEPAMKLADPARQKAHAAKIAAAEAELRKLEAEAKAQPDGGKSRAVELGIRKREVADLKKQTGPTTLVLEERKTPRESFLFIKGDFTRRGENVTPGTPAVLHPLVARASRPWNGSAGATPPIVAGAPPKDTGETPVPQQTPSRLDLAAWLVSPENPLTARVTVNRMWMRYFGAGLVETENDFGTQGTPPTHPELLDYLATEFVRVGWSQKAMHRLIVTSATYKQSSVARPDLAADPYNKLLGRQNRFRLDAEIVRDVALTASGLRVDKVGGPSVFPPIPAGVMSLGQVKREWKTSTGPDRYRRGMYTFLFRATPHPLLSGFDAPDGTSTCTRRLRSNTPLQSLTVLNDEAFIEFARALAGRVLAEPANESAEDKSRAGARRSQAGDDAARLTSAFRHATGRVPGADELAILSRLLAKQRTAFAADTKGAEALCATAAPKGVGKSEFAAWIIVARTMLNLDETMTRE